VSELEAFKYLIILIKLSNGVTATIVVQEEVKPIRPYHERRPPAIHHGKCHLLCNVDDTAKSGVRFHAQHIAGQDKRNTTNLNPTLSSIQINHHSTPLIAMLGFYTCIVHLLFLVVGFRVYSLILARILIVCQKLEDRRTG
jgi:hypothetical protein